MLFSDFIERSVIIPDTKPGKDHNHTGNYKIILVNLNENLSSRIINEQHAFRPQHSTILQLVNVVDQLSVNVNSNKQ